MMTVVAVGLLWLLAAVLAIILFAAIFFNMKVGMRFRQDLANRIHGLRLGRMLNALGIDIDSYLHSEPVVDIENQITRCTQCANTDECDEKLTSDSIKPDEIAFCNNEKSLQEIAGKTSGTAVNP
ncbi:MAG: hypothetical protein EP297_13645 [Gammaproteobacteria bacterium]|nr:MAG: hypothetical protein EP297_13645 [Gammaproteobacteria bacterium]